MGIKIKEWNSLSEFKRDNKITSNKIKVIIPAYNEEKPHVIKEIPNSVSEIIIISNNSTDNTIKVATAAGATTFQKTGKGMAMLA
jgi:glycosyltransferase involved in cell wall biosynthesis